MKRWITLFVIILVGMVVGLALVERDGVRVRRHASLPAFVLDLPDDVIQFHVELGPDENQDALPDLLLVRARKVGIKLWRSLRTGRVRPKYRADSAYWIATNNGKVMRRIQAADLVNLGIRTSAQGENQVVQSGRDIPTLVVGAAPSIWEPPDFTYIGNGRNYGRMGDGHHRLGKKASLFEIPSEGVVYEASLGTGSRVHASDRLREQGRFLFSTPDESLPIWRLTEFRLTTMTESVFEIESQALGIAPGSAASWDFLTLLSEPDEALRTLLLVEEPSGMRIYDASFAADSVDSRLLWEFPGVSSPASMANRISVELTQTGPWIAVASIDSLRSLSTGTAPKLQLHVRPPTGKPQLTSIPFAAFASKPSGDWEVFELHSQAVPDQDGDGVPDFIVLIECMGEHDLAVWSICSGATGELIPQKAQPKAPRR